MTYKTASLPVVGEILLVKRRGAKNLRLSIRPDGKIRISLPTWVPYAAAIKFAADRQAWIVAHRAEHLPAVLKNGQRIGKSYRLKFELTTDTNRTYATLGINTIIIKSHLNLSDISVQKRALQACEHALKKEAERLLPQRLHYLASKNKVAYKAVGIKRLTSRWGSCSNSGQITLNYYLVQMPWRLIDYVIVHELAHTIHLNHSLEFWQLVGVMMPDAKQLRKEMRQHKPMLLPL